MSNLKEGWTQPICTDRTQPAMAPLSSTVSQTIESQPVNLLQTWKYRHLIIIASFSTWTKLARHSKPWPDCYWSADKKKWGGNETTTLCSVDIRQMWCDKVWGLGGICCASKVDKHWCRVSGQHEDHSERHRKVNFKCWWLFRNKRFAGMKIQILFLVLLRWHFKF